MEQAEELRLADRDAAVAFNRSLPCKADVTDVEDEGDTVLAAFRLRDGPGGPCDGRGARALSLPRRQVQRVAPAGRAGAARGGPAV